jgi:hypothetical protein
MPINDREIISLPGANLATRIRPHRVISIIPNIGQTKLGVAPVSIWHSPFRTTRDVLTFGVKLPTCSPRRPNGQLIGRILPSNDSRRPWRPNTTPIWSSKISSNNSNPSRRQEPVRSQWVRGKRRMDTGVIMCIITIRITRATPIMVAK